MYSVSHDKRSNIPGTKLHNAAVPCRINRGFGDDNNSKNKSTAAESVKYCQLIGSYAKFAKFAVTCSWASENAEKHDEFLNLWSSLKTLQFLYPPTNIRCFIIFIHQ